MKKHIVLAAVCALFLIGGSAFGAEKSSTETGKEMFNDPKLSGSANGSSCNSCHKGGKGLENAGEKKKLTKLINNCLVGNMEGEKMDGRKAPMRSLKKYVQTLNN